MKIEVDLSIEPIDEAKIHYMILDIVALCDKIEAIPGLEKVTITRLLLEVDKTV